MGKTARDRQCKKISKKKATRQRLRLIARRVGYTFTALSVLTAGTVGWSIWHSGKLARWQQQVVDAGWRATADAGFRLEKIYLTGHEKVDGRTVLSAMDAARGQPILEFSLAEMKERLEKIPLVKRAEISRNLPHSLRIHVVEREPVAIWQYQGQLQLVDAEGVPLGKADLKENRKLPLLVGQMEPRHIQAFFAFLQKTPELGSEMETASLVSERRWNITLKQGIEVKLPEENLEMAASRLGELVAKNMLRRADIQVIDLRVPDRLFIRQQQPMVSEKGAQDT